VNPRYIVRRWASAIVGPALILPGIPAYRATVHAPGGTSASVDAYLDGIRDDPRRLEEFMADLPKGGDLHTHLSGAVPTGILIDLAAVDRLCIDTTTSVATSPPCGKNQLPATEATEGGPFHDRVVRAWSMEGFSGPGVRAGHDHFFATFGKFGRATVHKGAMLAAVASNAAAEHVSYLELMIGRRVAPLNPAEIAWSDDFPAMEREIIGSGRFDHAVKATIAGMDRDFAEMRRKLRCGTVHADRGCEVTIRIDHQAHRIGAPASVFADLLLGFVLAEHDPRIVGVNLVQAEDAPSATRHYDLQMRMIRFLRKAHPRTHVTLHAGELTSQLAGPDALRSHVRDAVTVAGAERIGHGVDIAGEDGAVDTLRTMADRHVLVEIALTSNCQVLRVCGTRHPFSLYQRNRVPVALATDDEGVEHTDLTHEYLRAARDYHLGYHDLKTLARASLEHAFLQGESLWRKPDDYRPVDACAREGLGARRPGARCETFLRASPKAALQWRQEADFGRFELRYGEGRTEPADI
jgi:adenosine deaminase